VREVLKPLLKLPLLAIKLFFFFLKFGHRRRWAVYHFRKHLLGQGLPVEIANKLAEQYASFISLRNLKRFLI